MPEEDPIDEIMKRVHRLEVRAKKLVSESFSGEYHSSFKGQGLDFDDHREYQHGDETRAIDWNVTARTGTPYIRQFREERELTVILAIDVSASMHYGSVEFSKLETAAEVAAILAFSAQSNGDKVGLLLYAHEPILFLPPVKSTHQVLRLVREILTANLGEKPTHLPATSKFLLRTLKRKSLIFLLSDFLDTDLHRPLAQLAHRHDLVAIRLADPAENRLPRVGKIHLRDPENGHLRLTNTNNPNLRMGHKKLRARFTEGLSKLFKKNNITHTTIHTNRDPLPNLHKLLKTHAKRKP